jgi:hypothetical protein
LDKLNPKQVKITIDDEIWLNDYYTSIAFGSLSTYILCHMIITQKLFTR